MQIINTALDSEICHTYHVIYVIGQRASFAIPTSIGSSVLAVCQMGLGSSSAPSLVLNSKNAVTEPHGNQATSHDGVCALSVETFHQGIAAVHLRYRSTTCVFETSQ